MEYGRTTAYGGQTTLDMAMTTSHSVTLSSLQMATLYYVLVKSKDAAGNAAAPALLQFATTAPATTNAGGTASVTMNCVAGLGWTSSVNGANWAPVMPGTGPVTVTAKDPVNNGTGKAAMGVFNYVFQGYATRGQASTA